MERNHIALIDRDHARRAQIVAALSLKGRHVEPFEDMREFAARPHDRSVVLVHDEGSMLSDLLGWSREAGQLVGAIAYREQPSPRDVAAAIRSGALDYCPWPADTDELADAVEICETLSVGEWGEAEQKLSNKKLIDRLTRREKQVLGEMVKGLSNRAIAQQFAISVRTVELHRAHLIAKLGAANSAEAVRMFVQAGLAN